MSLEDAAGREFATSGSSFTALFSSRSATEVSNASLQSHSEALTKSTLWSKNKQAKFSYYADLVWSLANLLFLLAWVFFQPQVFSHTFLEQGFCNKDPAVMPWTTQYQCFRVDLSAAAAVCMLGVVCRLPLDTRTAVAWGNGVLYPVAHGFAHWAVYHGLLPSNQNVEQPIEVLGLATILIMGPIGVYSNLKRKKWTTKRSLLLALVLELLLVGVFLCFFRKGVYALLYINVSINLVLMGSRMLLFGPNDVEERLEIFGPNVYTLVAAVTTVMLVMWIEPTTQCDTWFASAGGHVWFDAALAVMGATTFWNAIQSRKNVKMKLYNGRTSTEQSE